VEKRTGGSKHQDLTGGTQQREEAGCRKQEAEAEASLQRRKLMFRVKESGHRIWNGRDTASLSFLRRRS
jgi:hypothetical protein